MQLIFWGTTPVCKLQASILASIKYKVQTSIGVSEGTHPNTEEYALHGTGQRVGNSGTNWNFHSVLIMSIIDKECEVFKMNSTNKNQIDKILQYSSMIQDNM